MEIGNSTWIPEEAEELQLRLLIVAYCVIGGHRGAEATENVIRQQFTWKTLKEDAHEFADDYIHCMMAKTGLNIPRPMTETLYATSPNDVMYFDFSLYRNES